MRIRSTKPEFWKSRRITSVSWEARLVLKGLESYVDDNGVGVDDIELIVTDVFPRDMFASGRETVARVSEAISELHRAGLVWRYEGPGDHLLYISFWEEIQRIDKPGKGRNPRPDGTLEYKESVIRESVASPPVTLAPGTGEQGNRGTGEQGRKELFNADASNEPKVSKSLYSNMFTEWWQHYPRRQSKGDAFKAWEQLRRAGALPSLDVLIPAAQRYAQVEQRPEFQKLPAGWLRDRKWEDETTHAPRTKTDAALDVIEMGRRMQQQAEMKEVGW